MKVEGTRNKTRKRILTVHGYYEIFEPSHPMAKKNGYVREHRMLAWDAGLLTDPAMEVHHKNGIKTDNRLENFQILPKAKHTVLTWTGRKQPPWSKERRFAVSVRMQGNKNWRRNPDLIRDSQPRV